MECLIAAKVGVVSAQKRFLITGDKLSTRNGIVLCCLIGCKLLRFLLLLDISELKELKHIQARLASSSKNTGTVAG